MRRLGSALPVRILVKAFVSIGWAFDRIWSHAKFAALFPEASIDSACHWTVWITFPERLELGHRVNIGPHCWIGARGGIKIEDDVTISPDVTIETAGFDVAVAEPPYGYVSAPITIERGVWIGKGATILGGVTIGSGAFIGAEAVVTKSVPPRSVVVGAGQRYLGARSSRG